jgi:hypothetical protein
MLFTVHAIITGVYISATVNNHDTENFWRPCYLIFSEIMIWESILGKRKVWSPTYLHLISTTSCLHDAEVRKPYASGFRSPLSRSAYKNKTMKTRRLGLTWNWRDELQLPTFEQVVILCPSKILKIGNLQLDPSI